MTENVKRNSSFVNVKRKIKLLLFLFDDHVGGNVLIKTYECARCIVDHSNVPLSSSVLLMHSTLVLSSIVKRLDDNAMKIVNFAFEIVNWMGTVFG